MIMMITMTKPEGLLFSPELFSMQSLLQGDTAAVLLNVSLLVYIYPTIS